MFLKLKLKEEVGDLYSERSGYSGDAGFDLYCIYDQVIPAKSYSNKIKLGIFCEATSGFFLYPRSSMGSKTPLRLSNSVGIIDIGYRGELMAIVDNISDQDFEIRRGERYFQICSPGLKEITMEIVDELTPTQRGEGGFGSSGS